MFKTLMWHHAVILKTSFIFINIFHHSDKRSGQWQDTTQGYIYMQHHQQVRQGQDVVLRLPWWEDWVSSRVGCPRSITSQAVTLTQSVRWPGTEHTTLTLPGALSTSLHVHPWCYGYLLGTPRDESWNHKGSPESPKVANFEPFKSLIMYFPGLAPIMVSEVIQCPKRQQYWIMKGLAVKLKKLPVIEHHMGVTRQHWVGLGHS